MKLILLFFLSFNLNASELRTELLNKINENLPSNYSIEFTDINNCSIQFTSENTNELTNWNFNLLNMEYSFDESDFVFQCGDFDFCIDKTTKFLDRGREVTRSSRTYYFYSNNITRSELVSIFEELVEVCTPPTEEEIKESNHNVALAENARRGWGQTSVQ